ncbi:MAG: B12-binding domain-containing radical SAM protein [Oligoflexales bacterium]|nr:B12-binding domain-containing radical SAM protein [Oligoflexales bacterium]
MLDVLLIQPPIRDFYLTQKRTYPYGLVSIASSLRREGFSIAILDALATSKTKKIDLPEEMNYLLPYYGKIDISPIGLFHGYKHFGYSFEHIGKVTKDLKPRLAGISSLFTPYSGEAIECARTIRKFLPDAKIVLGGHHPTELPDEIMKYDFIDFVIRGDGEGCMPSLLKSLKGELSIESVPGLVYRRGEREVIKSIPYYKEKLDEKPHEADELVIHSFYRQKNGARSVVVASRGCPFECSYCSIGRPSGVPYRLRSASSVWDEIRFKIDNQKTRFIDFEDENLALDKTWFLTILKKISSTYSAGKIELRAMNGLQPRTLDEEVVLAMKNSGFKILNLSLGSSKTYLLKRFRRTDERAYLDRALELAGLNSMKAVVYMIVGAPDQSPEDSVDDLCYLAERKLLLGVSVFYPAPGSADYSLCLKKGLLPLHFSQMRSTALPISDLTTRDDSVTLLRLGRIINFIKQIIDNGIEISSLYKNYPQEDLKSVDNLNRGLILTSLFLNDGKIRGIDENGRLYEHQVSRKVCDAFLNRFDPERMKGT